MTETIAAAAAMPQSESYCFQCGPLIGGYVSFCPHCGKSAVQREIPQSLIDLEFSEEGRNRDLFPEGWYLLPIILIFVAGMVAAALALL